MLILETPRYNFRSVAFSPDGRHLAVGADKQRAQVWDLEHRRVVFEQTVVAATDASASVAFLDNHRLLIGNRLFIDECRWADNTTRNLFTTESTRVEYGAFTVAPNGSSLVLCDFHSRLQRYSLDQRAPALEWTASLDRYVGFALTCSADGSRIACGLYNGQVSIFDAATGRHLNTLGEEKAAQIGAVGISPDGKTIVWAGGPRLHFWREGETRYHSLGRTHFLGIAFHRSGDFFATAKGDGTVDTWDTRTGERRDSYDWKVGKLNGVAFDATGDRAAACSATGKIVIWDVDH